MFNQDKCVKINPRVHFLSELLVFIGVTYVDVVSVNGLVAGAAKDQVVHHLKPDQIGFNNTQASHRQP